MKKSLLVFWLIPFILICCKEKSQYTDLTDSPVLYNDSLSFNPAVAATNVKNLGITGNGGVSVSDKIQALIGSDKALFFPKGTYKINSVITIKNIKNLKIVGESGTVFTTNQNKIFTVSDQITNLEIQNIKFVSEKKAAQNDPEGLIFIANYSNNAVMDGIRIHHCTFTNPETQANGIKLVSEGTNSLVKNISITDNRFEHIGRMGVEFQNHNTSPVKARFRDYTISNNSFYDVGTIQKWPAPSCISVSGYAVNGKINYNDISDMRMNTSDYVYYGIENAGTVGLETIGNKMRSSTYGFTGILGSSPSEADSKRTGQPLKSNWIIRNNTFELTGRNPEKYKIRGMELNDVDGYTISNNTINSDNYAIRFINCKNGKITDNKAKVKSGNCLYFERGSTKNEIARNVLDASQGPDHGVVMFNGVSGNTAYQNTLIKTGNGSGSYVNLNGASNSTK